MSASELIQLVVGVLTIANGLLRLLHRSPVRGPGKIMGVVLVLLGLIITATALIRS